jgi:L-alanine-DL-glutamate epimerase-like enolase superfamily enzyme
MTGEPVIRQFEIETFTWDIVGEGLSPDGKTVYDPGTTTTRTGTAIKVYTDTGAVGEYVQDRGDAPQIAGAAQRLLGWNALERERVYQELKTSPVRGWIDIVLWDLAGKMVDLPIYRMLGGYRTKLPAYASTINGANKGKLSTPESFADFAQECQEMGYRAFKVHPYPWADVQTHIDTVLAVRERVGPEMDLMLDSFCIYKTFADAVKVGRACDQANYLWYEDPYADGGITPFSHNKLRELIRTPLLQGEKVHSLEERMAFILAKATDFVRGEVRGEGITATMKMAHAAESVGLDIELHAPGAAERQTMAAIRNSNYYEVSWVHPDVPDWEPPIYKKGYVPGLYGIDENGCVDVPQGPGLGVVYDWDYIKAHSQGRIVVSE